MRKDILNESCYISDKSSNQEYTSKLDNFKPIIIEKVDCCGASASRLKSIYIQNNYSQ